MCAINPKHSVHFLLSAYTSFDMTKEEFELQVVEKLCLIEQLLNRDGRFRFHIQEEPRS